ncbi:MAG: hypothetical protein FWC47_14000 [Oscillospiraceae bacterium]|nr:hypothetical protein [Oscillospiraceae bacterium]
MGNRIRTTLRTKEKKRTKFFLVSFIIFCFIVFSGFVYVNNAMSDLLTMDNDPKIKISLNPFELSVKTKKYYIYIDDKAKDNYINFINKIFKH